jgi:hypothetical protein
VTMGASEGISRMSEFACFDEHDYFLHRAMEVQFNNFNRT